MTAFSYVTILLGAAALLVIWTLSQRNKFNVKTLPPGPKSHWLMGNYVVSKKHCGPTLASLICQAQPSTHPWRYLEKLTHEYGPLFTIWIGQRPMIVIGTHKVAWDLLERKGGSSPSRPSSFYASDM